MQSGAQTTDTIYNMYRAYGEQQHLQNYHVRKDYDTKQQRMYKHHLIKMP